jgi:uncharacterized RDD family membrane protein YckC
LNTANTPPLKRRLASMLYEAMLLFAVLFISDWFFSTLLQQRHALQLRHAGQAWLFFVLSIYFVWFWTHGGQTLAMKTWRIRIIGPDGRAPRPARAIGRYLLSWMFVLPGLALASITDAKNWALVLIPGTNFLIWTVLVYLDPERQFLHDRIAGTRIVAA